MSTARLRHLLPALLALAWAALVFWASLDAQPFRRAVRLVGSDKLHHAVAYGVLAALSGWALSTRIRNPAKIWSRAFLLCLAYGALLESAQALLTRTRQAEWADLAANLVGATVASLLGWWLQRRRAPHLDA